MNNLAGSYFSETPDNISLQIVKQLLNNSLTKDRFTTLQKTQEFQSLPFRVGDSLMFKLTLKPPSTQGPLTGVVIADREYVIKIVAV